MILCISIRDQVISLSLETETPLDRNEIVTYEYISKLVALRVVIKRSNVFDETVLLLKTLSNIGDGYITE